MDLMKARSEYEKNLDEASSEEEKKEKMLRLTSLDLVSCSDPK